MEDIKAGDIEVLDGWFNAGFNTSTSGVVTSYWMGVMFSHIVQLHN